MDVKIAVCQKPPVLLNLKATMKRALESIEGAASEGAQLIVFPEAYLPGYPTWIWRLRPGGDMALGNTLHTELRNNSIDIAAGGLKPLCDAAKKHGIVVVMGLNEIDSEFSGSTIFNTMVVIRPDGSILNRHHC